MELMHYSLLLITLLLPITVARRVSDVKPAFELWISIACAIACYCFAANLDFEGSITLLLAEIVYGLMAILFSERRGKSLVFLSFRCGLLVAVASSHSYCLMVFAIWFGNEPLSYYPVFTSPEVIATTTAMLIFSLGALVALCWTVLQECKIRRGRAIGVPEANAVN